jgi:hypothetical protein
MKAQLCTSPCQESAQPLIQPVERLVFNCFYNENLWDWTHFLNSNIKKWIEQ